MKRFVFASLLVSLWLGTAWAGSAADEVQVLDPWVRQMPPNMTTSAGFLVLKNTGGTDHALVAAESPWCGSVELHTHIHDNGVMRMRPVKEMPVPAGGVTRLQPGGLHLMLMQLEHQLTAGARMPITLVFEDGSRKQIEAEVRRFDGMGGMSMSHGKMSGAHESMPMSHDMKMPHE